MRAISYSLITGSPRRRFVPPSLHPAGHHFTGDRDSLAALALAARVLPVGFLDVGVLAVGVLAVGVLAVGVLAAGMHNTRALSF